MKLYDGREKFYQYDTNQKLICEDCAVGEEIHFSNSAHGDAAICLTYDLDGVVVVDVPNLYLMYAVELNVYSMRTEDDGRCTISRHVFGVIPRKKPSDYVYEETEVKSYAELDRRIKKLEENAGAGIDIVGATAGQIAQIAEVDENGAPTKWQPADLPAVSAMTGATAETAGASGVVPAPAAGDEGKFLRGDGTWGEIDIPEGGGGGIDQDALQDAVNAAIERAKDGFLVFEDSYVDNTANWLTNGYTKVSQTATIGQPSQCTGADKWGVLFFIAENAENGTGTQMYFPIDGTYKGRIFTRSITQRTPGEWYLLPTMNDIPTGGGGGGTTDHTLGLSGAAVGQIARITAVNGVGVPTAWESVDLPAGGSGGGVWRRLSHWEKTDNIVIQPDAFDVSTGVYTVSSGHGLDSDIVVAPYLNGGSPVGYYAKVPAQIFNTNYLTLIVLSDTTFKLQSNGADITYTTTQTIAPEKFRFESALGYSVWKIIAEIKGLDDYDEILIVTSGQSSGGEIKPYIMPTVGLVHNLSWNDAWRPIPYTNADGNSYGEVLDKPGKADIIYAMIMYINNVAGYSMHRGYSMSFNGTDKGNRRTVEHINIFPKVKAAKMEYINSLANGTVFDVYAR